MQELGDWLVASGKLSAADLQRAKQVHQLSGGSFIQVLVRLGLVAERDIAQELVNHQGWQLLSAEDYPQEPVQDEGLISPLYMREQQVLPIADDGQVLRLAMLNPNDQQTLQAIALATGREVKAELALSSDLDAAYERLYGAGAQQAQDELASVDSGVAGVDDIERLRDMES